MRYHKLFLFVLINLLFRAQAADFYLLRPEEDSISDKFQLTDSLLNAGMPQQALEIAESAYTESIRLKVQPAMIKAILYRIKCWMQFEEEPLTKAVAMVNHEISKADMPSLAILNSVQGELLHEYYLQNQWRLRGRTATTTDPEDISTWDLLTLRNRISHHYLQSIKDGDELKRTNLEPFEKILEVERKSRKYRPTLFDLLAYRAVDYFAQIKSTLYLPSDELLLASEALFAESETFLNLPLSGYSSEFYPAQCFQILQQIAGFHYGITPGAALAEAELKRLKIAWQLSTVPNKDSLYIRALERLEKIYENSDAMTDIVFELAGEYRRIGQAYHPFTNPSPRLMLTKSLQKYQYIAARFPADTLAKVCLVIADELQRPQADIILPATIPPGESAKALVESRNLHAVRLKLIKIKAGYELDFFTNSLYDQERLEEYYQQAPLHDWKQTLPDDGDLQLHRSEIHISPLPRGVYILFAGPSTPSGIDKPLSSSVFWVSSMAYLVNTNQSELMDVIILDRQTGRPVKNVQAVCYKKSYSPENSKTILVPAGKYHTGKDGRFTVPKSKEPHLYQPYVFMFTSGKDMLISNDLYRGYSAWENKRQKETATILITDRSVYRPGDVVFYKGIVYESDGLTHSVLPNTSADILISNANHEKVYEKTLRTNEFGSFSGSFTIPAKGLPGMFMLTADRGFVLFKVEEYTLPKFEVSIDTLRQSYKLGQTIPVTGVVKAYSGNAITGANGGYTIKRQANFALPFRGGLWRRPAPVDNPVIIASGSLQIDNEGRFSFSCPAMEDRTKTPDKDDSYSFIIEVTVTDIQGETRSGQYSVSVGRNAWILDAELPKDINQNNFSGFIFKAFNHGGVQQKITGSIVIERLVNPRQVLRSRLWERPDRFVMSEQEHRKSFPTDIYDDENNPDLWPVEAMMFQGHFTSFVPLNPEAFHQWRPGRYRVKTIAYDNSGDTVRLTKYFTLFRPTSARMPASEWWWICQAKTTCKPGESALLLIGSSLKTQILMEVISKGKVAEKRIIRLNNNVHRIEIPVTPELEEGFKVQLYSVLRNRHLKETVDIVVNNSRKQLVMLLETSRQKLLPGSRETWRIKVGDDHGMPAKTEVLAVMYDGALDAVTPNDWRIFLPSWQYPVPERNFGASFSIAPRQTWPIYYESTSVDYLRNYERLNFFGVDNLFIGSEFNKSLMMRTGGYPSSMNTKADSQIEDAEKPEDDMPLQTGGQQIMVPVRRNFQKTAFFVPHLQTDKKGYAVFEFTLPESLTRWKFIGFAHDENMRLVRIDRDFLASRDLMVVTNPPRFFRQGDRTYFQAKVVNVASESLQAAVTLELLDAISLKPVESKFGLHTAEQKITIEAGGAAQISWPLSIPDDGPIAVTYRVKASTNILTDGEEAMIPVLSNKVLITETMPMHVNPGQSRTFSFAGLANSAKAAHHRLTLEVVTNPAWYAVQALPYLTETHIKSADAFFLRFYANTLAAFIVEKNPEIGRVMQVWQKLQPDALLSNLEKNQELKNIALEETPWLKEARSESARKRSIAVFFQPEQVERELNAALEQLLQLQAASGGWPWMTGMPENDYITRQIVAGLGRLISLGAVEINRFAGLASVLQRALQYLDADMKDEFRKMNVKSGQKYLSSKAIHYLWARSYFLPAFPLADNHRDFFSFWTAQATSYWIDQPVFMQGMAALALHRLGEKDHAKRIVLSLKNKALTSDEMGMYWRDLKYGHLWSEAPIETQSLLIEAFKQVLDDQVSVLKMQQWLIKQKQTQTWNNPRAASEAIYAILQSNSRTLSPNNEISITVGGLKIDVIGEALARQEAGSGYFKISWDPAEITPSMGKITLQNQGGTMGWGGLYWQYFQDTDKVTRQTSPLKITRQVLREVESTSGTRLEQINEDSPARVGDKVVLRIVLQNDRDLEFVHMKDLRTPAFEPVKQVSQYVFRDGVGYYENPRDVSTHFFFDKLPKGIYVFDYQVYVVQPGDFSSGFTSVQCLYAPEFGARSEGSRIQVIK